MFAVFNPMNERTKMALTAEQVSKMENVVLILGAKQIAAKGDNPQFRFSLNGCEFRVDEKYKKRGFYCFDVTFHRVPYAVSCYAAEKLQKTVVSSINVSMKRDVNAIAKSVLSRFSFDELKLVNDAYRSCETDYNTRNSEAAKLQNDIARLLQCPMPTTCNNVAPKWGEVASFRTYGGTLRKMEVELTCGKINIKLSEISLETLKDIARVVANQ